jgi:uncharacterized protein (TIGR00299 family) protein
VILHFDFSTGASGDKILGALLEVSEALELATFEELRAVGEALVPGVRIERQHVQQGGVQATGITVTEHDAPVRHWHEIRACIEAAGADGTLGREAASLALAAFGAIAEAEAAVHGCAVEQVHFHEVGAADSLIDICCSSFLLDKLAPRAVYATPLALGSGTFVCSHGELPVPAPATARLIEGLPVYAGAHTGELTTPTGAALARCFVSAWEPLPCVTPCASGYGAGSRSIPGTPNVVRVLAGQRWDWQVGQGGTGQVSHSGTETSNPQELFGQKGTLAPSPLIEGCVLLETNIDHLSPEALAFTCEELLAAGALDVWQEPITMKKGRLAVRLCVLVCAGVGRVFAERIIGLTGSLGVRSSYVERFCVPREIATEQMPCGLVAFKTAFVATPEGRLKLRRPEYADVARIAREQGLSFPEAYEQLGAQAE